MSDPHPTPPPPTLPPPTPPTSCSAIFAGFFRAGIIGFGGVLPITRRMIVEDRRWLNAEEFNDILALCQFLPGGNVINMSVAVGQRFRGPMGAVAGLAGLMAAPVAIVIALGLFYARFQELPAVRSAFVGLAAAAAGMIVAMAIKIAAPLQRDGAAIAVAAVCFTAIAVLRTPLLPTMAVMAPLGVLVAWRRGE